MVSTFSVSHTVAISGDVLSILWDRKAKMYESPTDGTQHATAREAMRSELTHYMQSCGLSGKALVREVRDNLSRMVEVEND